MLKGGSYFVCTYLQCYNISQWWLKCSIYITLCKFLFLMVADPLFLIWLHLSMSASLRNFPHCLLWHYELSRGWLWTSVMSSHEKLKVTLLTNKATCPVATLIFVYCWTVHHQEVLPTLLNSDTFTCERLISIKSQKRTLMSSKYMKAC